MKEWGRVVAVEDITLGDELVVDAVIGATMLELRSTAEFDEDGGVLRIAGDELTYLNADDDTNTIGLAVATTKLYAAETPVKIVDSEIRYAHVLLDGSDDDEPLVARVPRALRDRIAAGLKDIGEPVLIQFENDEWVVTDVLSASPGARTIATFTYSGALMVFTYDSGWDSDDDYEIKKVRLRVGTAATSNVVVDVLINGTDSLWPDTNDRPKILTGDKSGSAKVDNVRINEDDFLTVDIISPGGASNLVTNVVMEQVT